MKVVDAQNPSFDKRPVLSSHLRAVYNASLKDIRESALQKVLLSVDILKTTHIGGLVKVVTVRALIGEEGRVPHKTWL